jgi:hypothetical protein
MKQSSNRFQVLLDHFDQREPNYHQNRKKVSKKKMQQSPKKKRII